MAVGDKLPVVMGAEKAVADGVATLDADGKLVEAQKPAYTGEEIPVSGKDGTSLSAALSNKADRQLSNLDTPQLALANLGAGVIPTLLINPYFINQKGQSSYTGGGYSADGVYSGVGINVAVSDSDITLTNAGIPIFTWFLTGITDFSEVAGKTYTASVLTSAGNFATTTVSLPSTKPSVDTNYGGSYIQGAGESAIFVTWSNSKGLALQISVSADSAPLTIPKGGLKIEEGPNQTLAYQDSAGMWHRLPQQEDNDYSNAMLNCRRYVEAIAGGRAHGVATSESFVALTYPFLVEKRAIPVLNTDKINLEKILFDNTAGTLVTPTAVSIRGARKGGAILGFMGAFTVGHEYSLISDTNGGYFDANL